MPVYHVELIRQDPDSSAYEVTTSDVSADNAVEAIDMVRDAAEDIGGRYDWELNSVECSIRYDMVVEGEATAAKRSWLCRLLGCGKGGE